MLHPEAVIRPRHFLERHLELVQREPVAAVADRVHVDLPSRLERTRSN